MDASKRLLMINTALFLGVAAIFFRVYLPVTEEITGLNQQLKSLEEQIDTLKNQSPGQKTVTTPGKRQLSALPESETEHLSQELAVLAAKHEMKLIQVEPNQEQAETVPRLKAKLTPYEMGFSGKNPQDFAELLVGLEKKFPELIIQAFTYDKNIGTVDAQLLTSSQSVRLFSP